MDAPHPHPLRQDTSLDKTLRKLRAAKYPEYAVYLFTCFIFVFTLANIASVLHSHIVLRSASGAATGESESEGDSHALRRRVNLRRLPSSMVNAMRITACRITITLGPGIRFTLIDAFICACHLLALLLLEFLNGKSTSVFHLLTKLTGCFFQHTMSLGF